MERSQLKVVFPNFNEMKCVKREECKILLFSIAFCMGIP